MVKVIIYEIDGNQVVITPVLDGDLTIEQVAEKDVPAGLVWRIVEESALPVAATVVTFPTITSRQLWLAAYRTMALKEDDVIAMTATMEDQEAAEELRIEIRKAQTYERDHPAMDDLAALVGLPVEQFNSLWRWAATL